MRPMIQITSAQLGLLNKYFEQAQRWGFTDLDADRTCSELHLGLSRKVNVSLEIVESVVSLAKEVHTKGHWRHPNKVSF